ncbi:MAG: lipocalin-like domain-containing protein [Bacteroidia bacterium]|nr:lipocalin-like domain-containing protein [Bacteroidia bacterium]
MKLSRNIYCLLFLLLFVSAKSQKKTATSVEQFKGLWILDKYELYDSISKKWSTETARMGYNGYILFDGNGHMALQITPAEYADFDINKRKDSLGIKVLANYYNNNLIFFANYKVDGNEIEHEVLSSTNPESIGAILKRDFEFKGKTLYLTPKTRFNGPKIRMKWVKVQ